MKMSKTWETLFNLTSFMKYLLQETLPEEKTESPMYVLHSLKELLTVTEACIEKVNLSSKIKKCSGNKDNSFSVDDIDKNNTSTDYKTRSIPEEFIKLSNEMLKGRPFGYYCRTCDTVIYKKKSWDKHNADSTHIYLEENCENKHSSCSHCNLIVFATFPEAELLFQYHQKQHILHGGPLEEKVNISKKNESNNSITPAFTELDKKMHCGQETGFYCHSCDKAFDDVSEWNLHFQDESHHTNESDNYNPFEMCKYCKLVTFASPAMQLLLKSLHLHGHNQITNVEDNDLKSTESNLRRSFENISLCSSNTSERGRTTHRSDHTRGQSSPRSYFIHDDFKQFNSLINLSNLCGCYYCRPCSASFTNKEDWTSHCNERKHISLMGSRKYVNWTGTCGYCQLKILGTRDTVKFYMTYHNKSHNKVLSYDEVKTSQDTNCYTRNYRSNRNKNVISSTNSLFKQSDNISDDENSYSNDSDESENKEVKINQSNTNISNPEKSWNASTQEDQLHVMVFQLVKNKRELKHKYGGSLPFTGFCMLCNYSSENAFKWQDHLITDYHCKKLSPMDGQARINDLNITILGSKYILEKCKSLIKGNFTTIDS